MYGDILMQNITIVPFMPCNTPAKFGARSTIPGSAPEEIAPLTTTAHTKLNMTKISLHPEYANVNINRPWTILLKTQANLRTFVIDIILA
jgi:hypothetical protein